MEKITKLLKNLGLSDSLISDYLDEKKSEKKDPETDATEFLGTLETKWASNNTPDWELEKRQIKGATYGTLQTDILQAAGKSDKDITHLKKRADGRIPITEVVKFLIEDGKKGTNADTETLNKTITEQQSEIETYKLRIDELSGKEKEYKDAQESFLSNFYRDQYLIKKISGVKNLKIAPEDVFQLRKEKLFGRAAFIKDGTDYKPMNPKDAKKPLYKLREGKETAEHEITDNLIAEIADEYINKSSEFKEEGKFSYSKNGNGEHKESSDPPPQYADVLADFNAQAARK